MLLKSILEIHPKVFNRINIKELSWPSHNINVVTLKPLGCPSVGVFGVIYLSKYTLCCEHLQLSKTFHHSPIQNVTILLYIYDPLSLGKHSYSIPPHMIRLFPPPCLTVKVVVLSEGGFPFFFQV